MWNSRGAPLQKQSELELLCERLARMHGDKFDPAPLLASKWAPFYRSTVRVRFACGEVKVGRVGCTKGWNPAFMLVRNGGFSSSDILRESDERVSDYAIRPWVLNTYDKDGQLVRWRAVWDEFTHYERCLAVRRRRYPELMGYVHRLEANLEAADERLAA
jgi:hypothetical protein